MADEQTAETTTTTTTTTDEMIPRREAQEAFKARDKAKQALRELQDAGLVLTPERLEQIKSLEAAAAKAEEDRAKKAGEFDSLRVQLVKQHEAALQAEREKATKAESELTSTLRGLAFAQASDWFGDSGKTVLTPEIAEAYFGRYVELDGRTVTVKDPEGNTILDPKTGKPAAFADAIGVLIDRLPNKDHVLRGSGKTGSGSSGGSGGSRDVLDLRTLTPEQRRDPKVLAALRASLPSGGVVMGEAYER